MSTAAITNRIAQTSARPRARITGVVYLLYFLTAVFAQLLLNRRLIIYGDAANIIANAFYVAVALLFYDMFKPVSKSISFTRGAL